LCLRSKSKGKRKIFVTMSGMVINIVRILQNLATNSIVIIENFAKSLKIIQKEKKIDFLDTLFLLFIGILCYLVFFRYLGDYSLRMWDESRNGINALEMLKNNNFLVTYFKGAPDLWNTKPPFLIWVIVAFFKLFGVSELTLRLPSAISASLTVLLIYVFSKLILKDRWVGLLGSLIILSSMGFPDIHIGRTGDYDALLTFLTFLGSVFTFYYIESKQNKDLYLSAIFWCLAVLTKGAAGLFMIPGILLYIIIKRRLREMVCNRTFWLVSLFFVLIIGGYYLSRNIMNSGYLSAVWKEDLFGRFGKAIGAVDHNFSYYWDWLKDFRFQKWIYLLPFSFVSYFLVKSQIYKNFIIYFFILTIGYFLIISYSETKQIWYDAQLYPLASILVAIFLLSLIRRFPILIRLIPILILCFYMQRYIRTNIAYIYRPDLEKDNSCLKYGYIFREYPNKFNGYVGIDKDEGFCMPFHFYLLKNDLKYKNITDIVPGDKIITCDSSVVSFSEHKYKIKRTMDKNGCWGLQILNPGI